MTRLADIIRRFRRWASLARFYWSKIDALEFPWCSRMSGRPDRVLRFAEFVMDRDALELRRGDERIRLQIQPFRVLEMLVENAGRVVTRDELRQRVWPANVVVDFDHGLNNAIARLREALGDPAGTPRFIETLPRIGYRFVFPADQVFAVPAEGVDAQAFFVPPGTDRLNTSAIRRVLAVLLVAGIALIAGIFLLLARHEIHSPAAVHTVAMLPVRDLSSDGNREHFAAGMTDALVAHLAQNAALRVVTRRMNEGSAGASLPLVDVARELRVDSVIDVALFRDEDRLHVDVSLAGADGHVQVMRYEEPLAAVFALQGRLASDIGDELASGSASAEPRASLPRSGNLEAYQLYLQGRHLWKRRSPESVTQSVDYFTRAIALDPAFAAAHAGLSESYVLAGGSSLVQSRHVSDIREPALAAASRALELDDRLPEAHAAMAMALGLQEGHEHDRSIQEHFAVALSLNPAYSDARLLFGNFLSRQGRQEEAIDQYREALLYDPVSPNIVSRLGKELVDTGREGEGILMLERAVEIEPWQFNSRIRLAWTYAALGRLDEAQAAFERAEQISPDTIHTRGGLAFVAAKRGDGLTAISLLNTMHRQSAEIDLPFLVAMTYVALQDREQALEWLARAAPLSRPSLKQGLFRLDAPIYDWVRDDRRFADIVRLVDQNVGRD